MIDTGNKIQPRLWQWDYLGMQPLVRELRSFVTGLPAQYRLLDLGCGNKPYQALFTGASQYVGVDAVAGPHVDVVAPAWQLPFPDNSFDVVISTQVLEHTRDVEAAVREIRRVATPGAHIFISAPLTFIEHGAPHDYWRFTQYGLRHLFREFTVVRLVGLNGYLNTICRLLNTFVQYVPLPRLLLAPGFFLLNVLGLASDALVAGVARLCNRSAVIQKAYHSVYRGMPENYILVARNTK